MNLKSFILKIYIPNYENILEYSFSNGQLCIENKDSFTPNANVKNILETNCRKFFSEMYSYPNCKKKIPSSSIFATTNTVVLKNKKLFSVAPIASVIHSLSLSSSLKSFIPKSYPYSTARKIYTHSRKSQFRRRDN